MRSGIDALAPEARCSQLSPCVPPHLRHSFRAHDDVPNFPHAQDRVRPGPWFPRFLWQHGHTSPFRHSFYTFHWKAPLFVFRQAFKYQVGSGWRTYEVEGQEVSLAVFDVLFDTDKGCSWNEISGRYVEWEPFLAGIETPVFPEDDDIEAAEE